MELRSWRKIQEEKGILVVVDNRYEWFLLWWYSNLRQFCSLPVLFVDFGMTEKAKSWCKEKGYYFCLNNLRSEIEKLRSSDFTALLWGRCKSDSVDFHIKPFAMMHTIFKYTLFLDVDCEVKAPLKEIFSLVESHNFCCAKDSAQVKDFKSDLRLNLIEAGLLHPEQTIYNSGVILYSHKSNIITKWVQMTLEKGTLFCGDQELLSFIIHQNKFSLYELDEKWNWKKYFKGSEEAYIVHWVSENKVKLLQALYPDGKHPF